ncbi:Gfo/Idh/MocA family oxidoreductase [Aureimonas fodinaquatilis]|uniref:Gfo/Idh/MocA family oxidoreductase n=1 Tax=Aureimonas fodinaquatilis TaxID=2565783 RepID=A0A5B0DZS8_9HYPH|nr:Gfo/Idh/MocA family oxidoreductase [Aureimonas fodinaquatilis]KAA0972053.1 Gfo/Idh/MocA family oxidoreductase [Aureimonas fodinaquatilis]
MKPVQLAIVGLGKIARDQHLPAIAASAGFELAAIASRNASLPGIASFNSLDDMLEQAPDVQAVALCTPPQGRHLLAAQALRAGKHVLLEKPPGATVAEIAPLQALAIENGVSLFTTWHSRHAAAVEPARQVLARAKISSAHVAWKEDVRQWHPGQQWIWEPGGLGVFDPGINALSILTRILPQALFLDQAVLQFPSNRDTPIAATMRFQDGNGLAVTVDLDWRQLGPQIWHIVLETDLGEVRVDEGGKILQVAGQTQVADVDAEYAGIYAHFAELIRRGESDVDLTPLVHVADAFLIGRRETVEPFEDAV